VFFSRLKVCHELKASSSSTYPPQFAEALRKRWDEREFATKLLPEDSSLVVLVDTMFQASLLREEADPVQCRILFAEPTAFGAEGEEPFRKLHVLKFANPTAYSPHNLRKLAGAAGYYRSLLTVGTDDAGNLIIWGMVITGTKWVNNVRGGKPHGIPLPNNLVLQILGPGHLVAASGYERVLESTRGQLLTEGFDPFLSMWLPKRFGGIRESLLQQLSEGHSCESSLSTTDVSNDSYAGTKMCDSFIKDVAQSVVRRVLRLVRIGGHGGMLIYLPDGAADTSLPDDWFRFRVRFEPETSTLRFRTLMLRLMKRSLEVGEALGLAVVTWNDYQQMQDAELSEIDSAMVEFGHLLADLMSVDGSLVLDRSFRLIGFGAEILGDTPALRIERALDLEAEKTVTENADTSGTRHRSAFRLVSGLPEAIAVVVSQDGDVRFVANHREKLTYWPYLP